MSKEMIYKQSALDILDDFQSDIENGTPHAYSTARQRILGLYPRNPKWIPCEERLPEEEGNYLVTFGAFAETINGEKVIFGDIDGSVSEIGYGCYERDIFWHPTAFSWYDLATVTPFDKRAIIAWMPLPEPWKGADDE